MDILKGCGISLEDLEDLEDQIMIFSWNVSL